MVLHRVGGASGGMAAGATVIGARPSDASCRAAGLSGGTPVLAMPRAARAAWCRPAANGRIPAVGNGA